MLADKVVLATQFDVDFIQKLFAKQISALRTH